MIYKLKKTTQFKKDYKLAVKRGLPIEDLRTVIGLLMNDEPLPENLCDHALTGQWKGFRECHVKPDWLLIYLKEEEIITLTLVATGSHSDLFKK